MDPIITSRLDNDFYAFTMGQLIWKYFKDVTVRYKFFARDSWLDASLLAELKSQISECQMNFFTKEDIDYLRGLGIFEENYLHWLACDAAASLPDVECWADKNGKIQLEYSGSWAAAVFWETPLLAILTEFFMGQQEPISYSTSMERFFNKSQALGDVPYYNIKIMEFGSRRRASKLNQERILRALKEYNEPNLLGTSNVMFAKDLDLKPMGTMAHQLFMVLAALFKSNHFGGYHKDWLAQTHENVIYFFERLYGNYPEMLIYLPDTFGTNVGLACMDSVTVKSWAGIRQDSGNPWKQIISIIDYYEGCGIDPKSKLIVPSDGLKISDVIALSSYFGDTCNLAYGVGTSLTNDVGMRAPNFVIKPMSANGEPCIKLSDAPGKITGNSEIVAEYQQAAIDLLSNV